jgi:hypothetical protein
MKRIHSIVGVLTGVLLSSTALAVNLPYAPCAGAQFGCGGGPTNIFFNALSGAGGVGTNSIVSQLLYAAAGIAILVIIWAGFQMVINTGDEGKVTQQKWAIAYALIGLSVAILSQFVISVVGTQEYGQTMGGWLPQNIMSQAAFILRNALNAIFLLMIVVAGLKMVYAQGAAEEYNAGKKMLTWGMIGAVIVNLAAALVYAVAYFFGVL